MRRILLFTLLLFSTLLVAQKSPMKWGKIDQAHLDMTVFEPDSSASAVVLCDYAAIDFQIASAIEIVTNRHVRMKLLNQAAIDQYGDIVITHLKDSPLNGLKANVIQPNGDITSIGKKEWFTEKVSDNVSRKKLSLPQLKPGVVIEYKYQLASRNWRSIPSWKFQREIPTLHSELRVDMPDWFYYVEMTEGNLMVDKQTRRHTEVMGQYSIDLEMKTYIAKDVPALREESYVSTMDDYLAGVRFQLSEFRPTTAPWEKYITSWEDVSKILMDESSFGAQYLKAGRSRVVADAIEPVLQGMTKDKEIAIAIYDFVNETIKTERGGSSLYSTVGMNDVYKARMGTVADKNLMMLALLQAYDIPSFPVLLSTRSNGKPYPIYPYVGQFDHMMVCAIVDDKAFYMDAGNKYRPAGMPRVDALNKMVLGITDNPQWIDITASKSTDIILANLKVDLEGNVTGDFTANSSGYSAVNERIDLADATAKEIWNERLVSKYPDAEVASATLENEDEIYKPLKCELEITVPSAAQVSGDFIYINPIFYTTFDEHPFKLEKRDFPVDMPYPIKEQLVYNFEMPDGYILDDAPENTRVSLPEKGGSFQFMVSQTDNKVQVICKLMVNKTYYTPEKYYEIKQLFDMFMEKAGEQLVLKKA